MFKQCNDKDHVGESYLSTDQFYTDGSDSHRLMSRCKKCSSRKAQIWRKHRAEDPQWRLKFNDQNTKYRHAAGKVGQLFEAAKGRARKKGMEFTITKDDIIIPTLCPILGIPILAGRGRKSDEPINKLVGATDNSPSLDRIDNSKGYIPGNIRVISWRANYLKNNANMDELIKLGEDALRIKNSNKE